MLFWHKAPTISNELTTLGMMSKISSLVISSDSDITFQEFIFHKRIHHSYKKEPFLFTLLYSYSSRNCLEFSCLHLLSILSIACLPKIFKLWRNSQILWNCRQLKACFKMHLSGHLSWTEMVFQPEAIFSLTRANKCIRLANI